ncbi:hypothetical protein M758_UG003400 [Ceratodon purpureus]|nr:hypothetical protein M758_UG003400 [Ceratodon purpureus]
MPSSIELKEQLCSHPREELYRELWSPPTILGKPREWIVVGGASTFQIVPDLVQLHLRDFVTRSPGVFPDLLGGMLSHVSPSRPECPLFLRRAFPLQVTIIAV